MIDQKSRIVFEISWPANIPQKGFSTQKELGIKIDIDRVKKQLKSNIELVFDIKLTQ